MLAALGCMELDKSSLRYLGTFAGTCEAFEDHETSTAKPYTTASSTGRHTTSVDSSRVWLMARSRHSQYLGLVVPCISYWLRVGRLVPYQPQSGFAVGFE